MGVRSNANASVHPNTPHAERSCWGLDCGQSAAPSINVLIL
jgi:hypothetical protein